VLVLGIETSTPQTTVALGTEQGLVASALVGAGQATHEVVVPTVERLLQWSNLRLSSVTGIAVGLGPGLFTGMRVGIATAKTLSQVLAVPVAGLPSLDILAFSVRHARRLVCATVDAKRGELFYSFYRPVPGGVTRETPFQVGSPDHLAAELEAHPEDVLVVGGGALVYRRTLEEAGGHVELGPAALAFPPAGSLVELAIPRFEREEFDRLYELAPLYMRKSDAEINWDRRRG
jgi:tRNA threonylcarbamoyladenosine biosynthesis protein TsaB